MPGTTNGITANTIERMIFDAGALYRNFGVAGEERIGATRGGATFSVEREDREIEVDGQKGPTKGLRRTIRHTARLEATLVEFSRKTLLDLTRGTATTVGNRQVITPSNDIVAADFYANIALVADVSGADEPCVLLLKNAMAVGEWSIALDDQDEGETEMTIEAHYDPAAITVPPYVLEWPTEVS